MNIKFISPERHPSCEVNSNEIKKKMKASERKREQIIYALYIEMRAIVSLTQIH